MPALQQIIDSRHFAELMAEERLEPRGTWREDYRAALVCSVVANCHRAKRSKPYTYKDFMPVFEAVAKEPMSMEQQKAVARALNAMMGGTEAKRGDDSKPGR